MPSRPAPRVLTLSTFALLLALTFPPLAPAQTEPLSIRFERVIAAYEAADRATPPSPNAILLAGDSQFYRWKTLTEDLPGYTVINRGIDSFQTADLIHYFNRLVRPYRPRFIVLHVGGNDVNRGKSPEQILADFKTFVTLVRETQPDVPIAFTSITLSPGRWSQADTRRQANNLVRDYTATQPNLHFIDLWDAMLTADGQPREDLWVEDRIHPNQTGYRIRVSTMRPLLGPPDAP